MADTQSGCRVVSQKLTYIGVTSTSLFIFIGVATNLYLAILIMVKKIFWKNAYVYIAQINISAILFLLLTVLEVKSLLGKMFVFSDQVCRISNWFVESIFIGQMLIILCLTYERYIAVFRPLTYNNNIKIALMKSGLCWIGAFIYGVGFYFCYRVMVDNCNDRICLFDRNGLLLPQILYTFQVVIIYFIPLITMIYVYTKIILWKREIVLKEHPEIREGMSRRQKATLKEHKEFMALIHLAMGVVCLFIFAWTPFLVTRHFYFFTKNKSVFPRRVCQTLIVAFPSLNAIVCICTNKVLLSETKKFLHLKSSTSDDSPGTVAQEAVPEL